MQIQDHRMQCLRMAFELGGNPDAVLAAAERLLQFASGHQPVDAPVETAATPADPEAEAPAAIVADPIAACGTAMLMTPSGDLADATPAPELALADAAPSGAGVESDPAAVEAAAAEDRAPVELAAEAAEPEPVVEAAAVAEEAPAIEAAPEAVASAVEPAAIGVAAADPADVAEATPASEEAPAVEAAAGTIETTEAEASSDEVPLPVIAAVEEAAAASHTAH